MFFIFRWIRITARCDRVLAADAVVLADDGQLAATLPTEHSRRLFYRIALLLVDAGGAVCVVPLVDPPIGPL